MEPPRLIAPRHVHHNDDAWYALEGTLRVQSGENEIEPPAGSAVLVPRERTPASIQQLFRKHDSGLL